MQNPSRQIFCITLGPIAKPVAQLFQATQWEVVSTDDLHTAQTILQRQNFFACVLVLTQVNQALIGEIETCMQLSGNAEWVGVFDACITKSVILRDLIVGHFFDYHTDPVDERYLSQTVGHAFGRAALRTWQRNDSIAPENMGMVGQSAAMGALRGAIRKVGGTTAPVLIAGESGSGKELAAQAIHQHSSRFSAGPFVAVNCGAISPTLIQSELFGHERGAFTGATTSRRGLIESANGGTLFLDEIGDLPIDLQAHLLRFLQEKTVTRVGASIAKQVDVRILSASHVDLANAVRSGQFREDLFYRLNVLTITVPPLRERKDDLLLLAQHFFDRCANARSTRARGFSRQAIAALTSHDWPGNVRELFNCVQRGVVMTEKRMIDAADLGLFSPELPRGSEVELHTARTVAERAAIYLSLDRVGKNITHAARELGISRTTLYRLMEKHGIEARNCEQLPKV